MTERLEPAEEANSKHGSIMARTESNQGSEARLPMDRRHLLGLACAGPHSAGKGAQESLLGSLASLGCFLSSVWANFHSVTCSSAPLQGLSYISVLQAYKSQVRTHSFIFSAVTLGWNSDSGAGSMPPYAPFRPELLVRAHAGRIVKNS